MTMPPPAPQFKPFLTIIPGRRPEQKAHTSIGQAKSAVGYSSWGGGYYLQECIDGTFTGRRKYSTPVRGGQIWEYVDGDWKLLFDIPAGAHDHEVPWRAHEFENFVVDEEWNKG